MSSLWASTYEASIAPTLSDDDDDPAGPFAGLFVAAAGTIVLWNRSGPQASNPITLEASAGDYIRWPVTRVGLTGTTATVFGLVSAIVAS